MSEYPATIRRLSRRSFLGSLATISVAFPVLGAALGACAAPAQPAAPTTVRAPEPRVGGTLTIGASVEPGHLDFNYTATPGARNVVENICSHLVKPNPENGEVLPDAAVSWQNVDPRTWQFKLRDGIKFHNGEPLDATSVKATFEASLLSDKVPATSTVKGRVAMVKSVEAPDPLTVVFRTAEPVSNFPAILYEVLLYPTKYYAEQGFAGFKERPVGSGPFKFASWSKGGALTIERFDGYFGEKAKLDKIVFRPMNEKSSRLAALQAGEISIATEIDPDDVDGVRSRGYQVASGPHGETWGLTFRATPGTPLNDVRVRKAINHAIDRDLLVNKMFGGLTRRADSFVGPDAFGYNPEIKGYAYDLALAKSLLKEAGYEKGFEIEFESGSTGGVKVAEIAQYLVAQLEQVGIRAKLSLMERGAFSAKYRDGTIAPLYLIGWFYYPLMDTQRVMSFVPPDKPYKKFFSTPELEKTIAEAGVTFDVEKRRRLWQQANQLFFDLAPMVFLYQGIGLYALVKNVQGFKVTPDTVLHLESVSLG